MKKSILFSLVIFFTGMYLTGCESLKGFDSLIQKPTVDFQGVSLKDMSLFDATLLFKFNVTNKNMFTVPLQNLSYQLKIDQKDLFKGQLDKSVKLNPNSTESVEIPIAVNYTQFFDSISDFIKKDEVAYNLQGVFKFGMLDIPYSKTGSLKIPKLPQISLKGIQVKKISFTGASLLLQLDVQNRNGFDLSILGLDYGIDLSGIKIASGKTQPIKDISGNSHTSVDIPVDLSFLALGQSAYKLLTHESGQYNLNGNMRFNVPKLGEKSFPFSKSGQVTLYK